jgi:glycine cleavage system H lipoate-binding protein/ABC-type phosphate transport system substrate-binding protein
MKRSIILLFSILLMSYSHLTAKALLNVSDLSEQDTVRVLSTPDLYTLSNKWANEYRKSFPELKIKVISVADSKEADLLLKKGGIGFVSNKYYSGFDSKTVQKVIVGRDIIVPIINANNPFIDEIYQRGISQENLIRVLGSRDSKKWGTLLNGKQSKSAKYYWVDDESVNEKIAEFLSIEQIKVKGHKTVNEEKLISEVQKDPYAFGFCKITSILDSENQSLKEGVRLLPIDRNGDGIIEYSEKIYDDYALFSRGVWIGKYPKALFTNIYSIYSNTANSESALAFIKWVLTDGQQFLFANGYSDLLVNERLSAIDKVNYIKPYANVITEEKSLLKTALWFLAFIIVSGLFVDVVVRYVRRRKIIAPFSASSSQHLLDETGVIIPGGLLFDKTHTWAFMEHNGFVTVGIDDFLQHITGTLTRIKMKKEGDRIKKGEQIFSIIQNGKQLNLYAPISGIIKEQNKVLDTDSSILNTSPYNEGWVYRIEPTNWMIEIQLLIVADKYKEWLKNEFSRIKDFLAFYLKSDGEKYAHVILQDGGELIDGTLSDLGPEVWEDFQTKFIDYSKYQKI